MNLLQLIFGMLSLLLLAGAGVGLISSAIIGCCRKWKLAGRMALLSCTAAAFGWSWISWSDASDPYVRTHLSPAEIVGTYRPDQKTAAPWLRGMGYDNLAGEISFYSDGTFVAKDLPACCLHGLSEAKFSLSGGYYAASGTWQIVEQESITLLSVHVDQATLTHQPPVLRGMRFEDRREPRDPIRIYVLKGSPLQLGFSLWDGADFDDLIFARQ